MPLSADPTLRTSFRVLTDESFLMFLNFSASERPLPFRITFGGLNFDGESVGHPAGTESEPCTQARVIAYQKGLTNRLRPAAVTRARQIARSSLTKSLARPSASASTWLPELRRDVESEIKTNDVDFSQIPVEDAVGLILALASEDAESNLRALLKLLEGANEKGPEERELAAALLRERTSRLREHVCRYRDRESIGNEGGRPD
jgi:hypothetical protein